jgi:hypothetical protein
MPSGRNRASTAASETGDMETRKSLAGCARKGCRASDTAHAAHDSKVSREAHPSLCAASQPACLPVCLQPNTPPRLAPHLGHGAGGRTPHPATAGTQAEGQRALLPPRRMPPATRSTWPKDPNINTAAGWQAATDVASTGGRLHINGEKAPTSTCCGTGKKACRFIYATTSPQSRGTRKARTLQLT